MKLSSNSSCIDAANGEEAPSLDLEGANRFNVVNISNSDIGTPNNTDMGACQYSGE